MFSPRLAASLVAAVGGLGAVDAQAGVPIRPGPYVRDGVACRGAPFAAMIAFKDGAFSGPHDGACTTAILHRSGRRYLLRTTCRAAGDGTPEPPYTEDETVTIRSATHITFGHKTGTGAFDYAGYRLCPGATAAP